MSPSLAANDRAEKSAARNRRDRRRGTQPGHLGFPVERPDLPIGAALQQQLHDGGMAFGRRPHEGGLPLVLLARIHVRAALQQQPDHVGVPGAGRGHQHRLAIVGGQRLRVGAGFEERLDHRRASGADRFGQRGRAVAVPGLDVRARAKEERDGFFVVPDDRPMQSRGAVRLCGVDIDPALHQSAQRADVFLLRRVGRIRPGGLADRRDHRHNNKPGTARRQRLRRSVIVVCS